MQEIVIRYSNAFKRKVIKEVGEGVFRNLEEARVRYGIKSTSTINYWLKKYGRDDLLPRRVRIEMPDERSELKKLKRRIKELEKALADAKVGEVLNQAYFELVCEEAGIQDIESYKKKIANQLLEEE